MESEQDVTVGSFIRRLAVARQSHPLMVHEGRRLSYADAERQSRELAKGLAAAGVGKGTRVGLWMPNGPDWVIAWLAAARIGAVVVPINTFYQARELAWVLTHADCAVLLMSASHLGHDFEARLTSALPTLNATSGDLWLEAAPFLRRVFVWGSRGHAWAAPAPDALRALATAHPTLDETFLAAMEAQVFSADPMVLIYSSGSSGDPKGAIHTHGSVLRHARALNAHRHIGPDDRMYSPMPFFWVGGLVYSLLACMHAGATMLSEETFEPGRTLAMLERERATIAVGWPHYAKSMAEHPSFSERDLSRLHSGNLWAILPPERRPADPELRSNALGMTETSGPHTYDNMDRDLPEPLRGSFGHAVEGFEHKIVDPASGSTLGAGELGEICVRGPGVMQGLAKLERHDVFDADGYYHTGDSGYFDADGVLFYRGRLGELIKTGGANVTPREVEVALQAYPEVKEAYVVGLPDAARGEVVAAAVVLNVGHAVTAEALRGRLKKELAAYKVPRHVCLFESASLPFTDSGKIDKKRLVAALAARI